MLVSCLTLLDSQGSGTYYATSLVPAYAVLLVSVVIAVRGAGGLAERLKLNRESKKIQLLYTLLTDIEQTMGEKVRDNRRSSFSILSTTNISQSKN